MHQAPLFKRSFAEWRGAVLQFGSYDAAKKVSRLQYTKKSIRPEKENTVLSKKDTFGEEKANKTNSLRVQPSGNAL
jgi:hypothetical protein